MWKLLKTEARKRDELFEEINASEMGMLGDAGSTRRLVGLWRSNPGLSIGRIQVKASGRQALNKSQDPQIHRKLGKKHMMFEAAVKLCFGVALNNLR